MKPIIFIKASALLLMVISTLPLPDGRSESNTPRSYVGAQACKECHAEEYTSFQSNSKKARSFESVALMKDGLSKSETHTCFECHTTGYGEPGGFKSEQETPNLKNAGCESCHGPGSVHVQTQDPDDIKSKPKKTDCSRCHNSERVESFKFKPLIYGGAH